jgi:hypothetical protein
VKALNSKISSLIPMMPIKMNSTTTIQKQESFFNDNSSESEEDYSPCLRRREQEPKNKSKDKIEYERKMKKAF